MLVILFANLCYIYVDYDLPLRDVSGSQELSQITPDGDEARKRRLSSQGPSPGSAAYRFFSSQAGSPATKRIKLEKVDKEVEKTGLTYVLMNNGPR